jgi:hypothetical protein
MHDHAGQAKRQRQGAAAIKRLAQQPDAGQIHPHRRGVLKQNSVGRGAKGHRTDEEHIHDGEAGAGEEHQGPKAEVAAAQQRHQHDRGKEDTPEGDRQRPEVRLVQPEAGVLTQELGEGPARAPGQGGAHDAQTSPNHGGARGRIAHSTSLS